MKNTESPTVRNWKASGARKEQSASDAITRFSGSMTFVWLHVAWFAVWIIANLTLSDPFDPFPFGLLTLIVSLEAIFLSTFVLISQNRTGAQSDAKALQDFQTNIYSEVLSELIADKLGIHKSDVDAKYGDYLKRAGATSSTVPDPTPAGSS